MASIVGYNLTQDPMGKYVLQSSPLKPLERIYIGLVLLSNPFQFMNKILFKLIKPLGQFEPDLAGIVLGWSLFKIMSGNPC